MGGRKLNTKQQARLIEPITTAIIAMRLHRCRAEHAENVLAQLMISHRIAQLVPRHRHVLPEIQTAINALHAMFERWGQRTVEDAFISGTKDEVDALYLASQIYAALLKTTPLSTFKRALINVSEPKKNGNPIHSQSDGKPTRQPIRPVQQRSDDKQGSAQDRATSHASQH